MDPHAGADRPHGLRRGVRRCGPQGACAPTSSPAPTTIAHISFDGLATPHPYALMLPQSDTERLLEQHLNAHRRAVERRVELARFAADEDEVTAACAARTARGRDCRRRLDDRLRRRPQHRATRPRHGVRGRYAATATGSWPTFISPAARRRRTRWRSTGTPTACWLLFPIAAGRFRVIADVGDATPGDHPGDPTLEEVQALIDRRGPGGIKASAPIWLSGVHDQRAQGGRLSRRPRVSRRRRRPHPQSRRRAGHEHRHAGRLQSRLETGAGVAAAWPTRNRCSRATAPSAARSAVRFWPTPGA